MTAVVVGIDAGGSHTRCAVVDTDGRVLGRADTDGANPISTSAVSVALTAALRASLGSLRRADALVLGLAGSRALGRDAADRLLAAAVDDTGLVVDRLIVCTDVEAAYAAGTAEPDGAVLVAGSGAVAARIIGFGIARSVDGHGYLLGDRGSAAWLGRKAVQAVLAELEGRGPRTALTPSVLDRLPTTLRAEEGDEQALVTVAYAHPPARLGEFAPLVESCAMQGDPVAVDLLEAAVGALVATARPVAADPFVVTGGVAGGAGLLGRRVRDSLRRDLGVQPLVVGDARFGAVALAFRALPTPATAAAESIIRTTA